MFHERASHIWRPIMAKSDVCASHNRLNFFGRSAAMDTIYFLLAVAVVSTVIFMLMMRVDRINRRRGSSDGGSSDSSVNDSCAQKLVRPVRRRPKRLVTARRRASSALFRERCPGISGVTLESLKNAAFPFASPRAVPIFDWNASRKVCCPNDCLFLPRPQRSRRPRRREFGGHPSAQPQAALWLPRLQRRMRPLRPHHQGHHRRGARRLHPGLPGRLPARPSSKPTPTSPSRPPETPLN